MKIAISAANKTIDSSLDSRFGRCEYFIIYDTDKNSHEAVINSGISASGGAGIKAANQIIEIKAEVVITGNLGPNAYELLQSAQVKAYSCSKVSVKEAVELFQEGKLLEISNSGQSHHGI